jgi:hypothetical protein
LLLLRSAEGVFEKERIDNPDPVQITSQAYFENIQAPLKGFYTFQYSAHTPLLEEPGQVINILLTDALNKTNNLADND